MAARRYRRSGWAQRHDARERLHVTRQALSNLLNGNAGLSAEMAIPFKKAFGLKAYTLMRMQAAHALAEMRGREEEIVVEAA